MNEKNLTFGEKMNRPTLKKILRGAIEVDAVHVKGKPIFAAWQGREMFDSDISKFEERFEELELSHLLDWKNFEGLGINEPSIQIVSALGATDAEIESFNPLNNEAWFLTNFITFRVYLDHLGQKDADSSSVEFAIGLGRLIEWWRWRSKKFEQYAIDGKQRESGRQSGAKGTSRKAENQRQKSRVLVEKALKYYGWSFLTALPDQQADFIRKIAEDEYAGIFDFQKGKSRPLSWFQEQIEEMRAQGEIETMAKDKLEKG